MSRALGIEVEGIPLERARVGLTAVPLFEAERPLRGAAGRADWRLCGKLSSLLASGRLTGTPGEAALVASFGGLGAPLLLVLGAGRRQELDAARFEALAGEASRRALRLQIGVLALPFAEGGEPARDRLAAALVSGAAAAVAEAPDGAELRLLVVSPREELARTADLLRRTRKETLPKSLTLSLPAGGERGAEHRADHESAPRGSLLVK